MKFVTILASLIFCVGSAMADIPGAAKIDVLRDQKGRASFGFQYSKKPHPVVAITFSVKGRQLVGTKAGPIDPAYWVIINKDTGALVTSWTDTDFGSGYVTPDASEAFSVSAEGSQAVSILNEIHRMALVLSLKNAAQNLMPTVYIDLNDLCSSDPDGFVDLDSGHTGCP